MFQGLFKRAESTIDSVVAKFLARTLAAIPLVVAAGFATAAVTVKLVEIYGAVVACSIMAAGFAVIGLAAMAITGLDQRRSTDSAAEEATASSADTSADEPMLDPADLLTPEVRSFLSSAAPMAIPVVARGIGRNLPLILVLAVIGYIISRFGPSPDAQPKSEEQTGDIPADRAETPAAA